jgi:hypothetical protein
VALVATAGSLAAQRAADGAASAARAHADRQPLRVLFIGNSLTAANDLPQLLETIARAEGGARVECEAITAANFSLEDHWNRGDAARAIRDGHWSVVVLQQGPSALEESRALLLEYARRFAAEARRAQARTALYMVWPSRARFADFDRVSASYTAAAREVDGLVLPVGDAWTAAWRLDPDLALYGADGFHPSRAGSVLGALVIHRMLVGAGAATEREASSADAAAPAWSRALGLDARLALRLERAAAAAVEEAERRDPD